MRESPPAEELTTVLVSSDPAEQALAEDVLNQFDIPYFYRYSDVQHLVGFGQVGGSNLATGAPEIQVAAADELRAWEVLADALAVREGPAEAPELEPEEDEGSSPSARGSVLRWGRYSAVAAFLSVWGLGSIVGTLGSAFAVYFGVRALWHSRGTTPLQKTPALLGTLVGLASVVPFIILAVGSSAEP